MTVPLPETWQDWVVAIGSLLFFFALLPSILSKNKPSVWTSLLTASILTIFAVVYWTLGLTFGTATTALTATGWCVLFFQKARR